MAIQPQGLAQQSCTSDSTITCLQVDAALSADQFCHSLGTALNQKDWRWALLLGASMTYMPATMSRSDNLRKLQWACLSLEEQEEAGPMPSVAILCGNLGANGIPGFVRWAVCIGRLSP